MHAEPTSTRLGLGWFFATPEFNSEHKRILADDGGDERFQGLRADVALIVPVHARFGVLADLSATLAVGTPTRAINGRLGGHYAPRPTFGIELGVGIQALIMGTDEEGVGRSLHWNPLAFAALSYEVTTLDGGQRVRVFLDVEAIRVCSNWGGCDWGGDGAPSERGFAFNMVLGTVGIAFPL